MANTRNPFGFKYLYNDMDSSPNPMMLCCIPQASVDEFKPGDAVKAISGGDANGVPYVGKITNGTDAVRGVIEGIYLTAPSNINMQAIGPLDDVNQNAPATKTRDYYCAVRTDKDACYVLQGDFSAANQVATACNLNASFLVQPTAAITAGITNGSAVVTYATTGPLIQGTPVTGTGIPVGATIASVQDGVGFTLSSAATATNAGASLTLGSTPSRVSTTVLSGASIATANTLNLQIRGLYQEPGNGSGNVYGAYAQWIVKFNLTDNGNGFATGRTGV